MSGETLQPPPHGAGERPSLTMVGLGDSLMQGVGDSQGLGWFGRLCNSLQGELDLTAYNLGVRGNTTLELSRRAEPELRARVAPGDGNVVLVAIGTNDACLYRGRQRVPIGRSLQLIERTLDGIRPFGTVLWIGPVPVTADALEFTPEPGEVYRFEAERIAELNEAFRAVAMERQLPYFDLVAALAALAGRKAPLGEETSDGIHPRSAGYHALFELLSAWSHLQPDQLRALGSSNQSNQKRI